MTKRLGPILTVLLATCMAFLLKHYPMALQALDPEEEMEEYGNGKYDYWRSIVVAAVNPGVVYSNETDRLKEDDIVKQKFDYQRLVKNRKSKTIADWYLFYKGTPISLTAICVCILPLLVAGLIQRCIEFIRYKNADYIVRRTWEFPIAPVLYLQETSRERALRKKTIKRFSIPWEVNQINIKMNTRLVDLKQILHPPKKTERDLNRMTWKILRLIVRFNAFLSTKRLAQKRHDKELQHRKKNLIDTWNQKIHSSRYFIQSQEFKQAREKEEREEKEKQEREQRKKELHLEKEAQKKGRRRGRVEASQGGILEGADEYDDDDNVSLSRRKRTYHKPWLQGKEGRKPLKKKAFSFMNKKMGGWRQKKRDDRTMDVVDPDAQSGSGKEEDEEEKEDDEKDTVVHQDVADAD